jgi:hypothetical protein
LPISGFTQLNGYLKTKTLSDLVISGCAYLKLIKGESELRRDEILIAIKSGDHYYKQNMSSNLSQALETLVKNGKLNERKTGVYTFPQSMVDELKAKLA